MSARALTSKQRRFVEEYLVDLNATQAAIRAGYSKKTAGRIGAENMQKPVIADAIRAALDNRSERTEVDQDYVIENLTEVVERCLQRAPVMVRRGREMVQVRDEDGNHVWQFNAKGAVSALNLLGKHLGMFVHRVEHSGRIDTGVLAVPSSDIDPKLWEAVASRQQTALGHNGGSNGNGAG